MALGHMDHHLPLTEIPCQPELDLHLLIEVHSLQHHLHPIVDLGQLCQHHLVGHQPHHPLTEVQVHHHPHHPVVDHLHQYHLLLVEDLLHPHHLPAEDLHHHHLLPIEDLLDRHYPLQIEVVPFLLHLPAEHLVLFLKGLLVHLLRLQIGGRHLQGEVQVGHPHHHQAAVDLHPHLLLEVHLGLRLQIDQHLNYHQMHFRLHKHHHRHRQIEVGCHPLYRRRIPLL